MSRVAKKPVVIPAGVEVKFNDQIILVKGKHGELVHVIHKAIDVQRIDNQLIFALREGHTNGWAIAGTTRSILNGMMIGVTNGFTKKLQLIGVGYRVSVTGNVVNLSLGFSHRIDHTLPAGITAECQSQTEIILRGFDKQLIGQVSADLRAYRRPEPYKGKGMRYSDELVFTKEAKKK